MNSKDSRSIEFLDAKSIYGSTQGLIARSSAYHENMVFDEKTIANFSALNRMLMQARITIDVGCGLGDSLLPIGPQISNATGMVGVDISEAGLRLLQSNMRGSSALLVCADVCRLPFSPGLFELVLARHMLYHVSDIPLALAEIARILRPTGVLVASTNSIYGKSRLFEMHKTALAALKSPRLVNRGSGNFSSENGEEILRTRFTHVEALQWAGLLIFGTAEEALRYYENTVYFRRASEIEEQRLRLREEMESVLRAEVAQGGRFELPNSGTIFIASLPL